MSRELFTPIEPEPNDKGQWMQLLNQTNIRNAIAPKAWGPACWKFMDCLAFSYPLTPSPEQQANMAAYFHALKNVLPCYSCRRDFTQMMDDDPIERHLHSREALSRWLNDKHNRVNQKLGTPTISYPEYVSNFISATQPTTTTRDTPLVMGAQAQAPPPPPQSSATAGKWAALIVVLGLILGVGVVLAKAQRK